MDDPDIPERVQGLNPRELLARVAEHRGREIALLTWIPPSGDEIRELFQQFEEIELIGRGGMGAVYRARQPCLERFVALKLLPAGVAPDGDFAERFRQEARALARLKHPHIVDIYDSGQTGDGQLFIVMEYVGGSDLAGVLAGGAIPCARALTISAAICGALEYAHGRGIVHRDIKPANILLGSDGRVKVADFGLARLLGDPEGGNSHLTLAGTALGTPAYMSPEQRAGREVDGRTDLYSLGVMLYQMLTGELPEGAWRPPSGRSGVSPHLDRMVEFLLQADPRLRPRSATELRERLERALQRMTPAARRRRHTLAAAAGVAACGAGVWLWPYFHQPPASAGEAEPIRSKVIGFERLPPSPDGLLEPLAGLDLNIAVRGGGWRWVEDVPDGNLTIPYIEHPTAGPRVLLLPVQSGERAFDFSCRFLLEHQGSNLMVVFPAGAGQAALVLDLFNISGLERIRGLAWSNNASSVSRPLPTGRFLELKLAVRPRGDEVAIRAAIDSELDIQWAGAQKDLSIGNLNVLDHLLRLPAPFFALSTTHGAVQVKDLKVMIHPPDAIPPWSGRFP